MIFVFFRSGSANSVSGLIPCVKNKDLYRCPSDSDPTASRDLNNGTSIARSYIAIFPAESLQLTALPNPTDTTVITEKWGRDYNGAVGDSWIEPYNGDFSVDSHDSNRTFKAADRHAKQMNAVFFDSHAKATSGGMIRASKDLTGCQLMYSFPFPGPNPPTVTSTSSAPGQPNVCAGFTWP